jgi:hypothetical protein
MKMATVGIPIAIGMTTITTATNSSTYFPRAPIHSGRFSFLQSAPGATRDITVPHRYWDARFHCWCYR